MSGFGFLADASGSFRTESGRRAGGGTGSPDFDARVETRRGSVLEILVQIWEGVY